MSATSQQIVQASINSLQNPFTCAPFHEGISCNHKMVEQFINTFKSLHKTYLVVHIVPFLLFKRKKAKEQPTEETKKLITGFLKSMLFAAGYTALVKRFMCLYINLFENQGVCCGVAGSLAAVTLLFEPNSRRSQIALFTLNKSIETAYNMALRRKYPVRLPFGEGILLAFSLAIISYHYMNNKQSISGSYKKMIDKLLQDV